MTPNATNPPTELDLELKDIWNQTLGIGFLPDPNDFVEVTPTNPGTAYTIHRLPRVLQSSTVELPPNYVVDMRFSGFTMLDSGFEPKIGVGPGAPRGAGPFPTNVFEPNPRLLVTLSSGASEIVDFTTSDVGILFNEKGQLDRMVRLASDSEGTTHLIDELAVDSLRLFIAEIVTDLDTANPVNNPLNSETNLWVTVNRSTGSTNVGYNAPDGAGTTLDALSNLYNGALTLSLIHI